MKRLAVAAVFVCLAAPAFADESWQGRFAVDSATCMTDALVVSHSSLSWSSSSCRIGKMYKAGSVVHIQAECYGQPESVPVKLDSQGKDHLRLTWNRATVKDMKRCP